MRHLDRQTMWRSTVHRAVDVTRITRRYTFDDMSTLIILLDACHVNYVNQ